MERVVPVPSLESRIENRESRIENRWMVGTGDFNASLTG